MGGIPLATRVAHFSHGKLSLWPSPSRLIRGAEVAPEQRGGSWLAAERRKGVMTTAPAGLRASVRARASGAVELSTLQHTSPSPISEDERIECKNPPFTDD